MINSSELDNTTDSLIAAERADMVEALLRGELSQEDFDTYLLSIKKQKR